MARVDDQIAALRRRLGLSDEAFAQIERTASEEAWVAAVDLLSRMSDELIQRVEALEELTPEARAELARWVRDRWLGEREE